MVTTHTHSPRHFKYRWPMVTYALLHTAFHVISHVNKLANLREVSQIGGDGHPMQMRDRFRPPSAKTGLPWSDWCSVSVRNSPSFGNHQWWRWVSTGRRRCRSDKISTIHKPCYLICIVITCVPVARSKLFSARFLAKLCTIQCLVWPIWRNSLWRHSTLSLSVTLVNCVLIPQSAV